MAWPMTWQLLMGPHGHADWHLATGEGAPPSTLALWAATHPEPEEVDWIELVCCVLPAAAAAALRRALGCAARNDDGDGGGDDDDDKADEKRAGAGDDAPADDAASASSSGVGSNSEAVRSGRMKRLYAALGLLGVYVTWAIYAWFIFVRSARAARLPVLARANAASFRHSARDRHTACSSTSGWGPAARRSSRARGASASAWTTRSSGRTSSTRRCRRPSSWCCWTACASRAARAGWVSRRAIACSLARAPAARRLAPRLTGCAPPRRARAAETYADFVSVQSLLYDGAARNVWQQATTLIYSYRRVC
jgi:hypothetical protein